jgi:hypothetical protein
MAISAPTTAVVNRGFAPPAFRAVSISLMSASTRRWNDDKPQAFLQNAICNLIAPTKSGADAAGLAAAKPPRTIDTHC